MKNKTYPWKGSRLKYVLYMLSSWLPISRRKYNKFNFGVVEILAAHKEYLMMTRQDIMLLANRMVKFHGAELMKEKTTDKNDLMTDIKKKPEDNEHMYG